MLSPICVDKVYLAYGSTDLWKSIDSLAAIMKSFGVPFLAPFTPKTRRSSDLIVRKPLYKQPVTGNYLDTVSRRSGLYHKRGE